MPKLFNLSDSVMPIQAVTADQIANLARYGVVSGCGITWNNNLSADVAAGKLLIDGVVEDYNGGTYTITALRPTGSNRRWVLLTAGANDAMSQPAGAPAVSNAPTTYPLMPDVAAEHVLLGAVLLTATDTSLSTVAASRRAFDLRTPSPPQLSRLNEQVDVVDTDNALGTALEAVADIALELPTTAAKVQLRLGLRLSVPSGAGNSIEYVVERRDAAGTAVLHTILDETSVSATEAAPTGFDVEFPFFDEPASADERHYRVSAKRTGGAGAAIRKGSYLYARELL